MFRMTRLALREVMVVGGGTMGAGIAQVTAAAGQQVCLVDRSSDILAKSVGAMRKSLTRVAGKKFKDDAAGAEAFVEKILANVRTATDANEAVAAGEATLVIEAIVENMEAKKALFSGLDAHAPKDTIFATNTSSLSVTEMAKSTQRAGQFGGLHFFSPVPMMKLVEVVRGDATTDATYDALFAFSKQVGKVPVTCKDTKGFVVNRLLVPYLMEAVRMLERGDASAEDIDTAMKLGAGYPMGPLELSDAVGNDVTNAIIHGWHEEEPENPLFNPSPLLAKMVADGHFGVKAGKGFYTYPRK